MKIRARCKRDIATTLRELHKYSAEVKRHIHDGRTILEDYDVVADQIGRWELKVESAKVLESLVRILRNMAIAAIYELRTQKLQVLVVPRGMI
jgi:hypothetical protein